LAVTLDVSAEDMVDVESVLVFDWELVELHLVSARMHINPRKAQAIFFIFCILIFREQYTYLIKTSNKIFL
jgi:hypothetical protein